MSLNLPASLQTPDLFSVHREQQHFLQGGGSLGELYKNAASLLHPLVPRLWPSMKGAIACPFWMQRSKVTFGGILLKTEDTSWPEHFLASLAGVTAMGHATECLGTGPKRRLWHSAADTNNLSLLIKSTVIQITKPCNKQVPLSFFL